MTPPDSRDADTLRTLQRDTWGYVVSLGPLGLGGLALLPLMTQLLSPAQLGWMAVAEALLLPAGTLGMMGLKFAYLYRFARTTAAEQHTLLATCMALGGATSLACGLLVALLLTHPLLLAWMGWPGPAPMQHAWLLVLLVPVGTLQALLMTELRAQRRVRDTAIVSYAQLGVTLAASAWLTLVWPWGIDGFMAGQLLGQLFALAHTGWLLRGSLSQQGLSDLPERVAARVQADWAQAPALLRYGWPLTAGLLVRYGMDSLSRVMLAGLASLQAAADWLVVSRVLSVFDVLVANPFYMAWGGLVHHALRRPGAERVTSQVSRWALLASSLAAMLAAAAFVPLSQLMTGHARADLAWLFVLLLWGKWLALVKSPLCCGVQQTGHTGWALRNNALALVVFAPAAWGLVQLPPPWGQAHGMAAAMLLATLAPAVLLYRQSQGIVHQRVGPAPWVAAAAALVATACGASLVMP